MDTSNRVVVQSRPGDAQTEDFLSDLDDELQEWAHSVAPLARRLVADYQMERSVFANIEDPVFSHLQSFDTVESRLPFVTFGTALDYQRPADFHWQTMWELWEDRPALFDASTVAQKERDYLSSVFAAYGVRFPNRDASTWIEIASILDELHDGSVSEMLLHCGMDTGSLINHLDRKEFPFLSGPKLQPLYIRILTMAGVTLQNQHVAPVPIDSQIRWLTRTLIEPFADADRSDNDSIRDFWTGVADLTEFGALELDVPLWLVGSEWDNGGKSYLQNVCDELAYTGPT